MLREFILLFVVGVLFNLWLKKRDQVRYLERDFENGRQIGRSRLIKLTAFVSRLKYQPWRLHFLESFLRGLDAAVDILVSGKEPELPNPDFNLKDLKAKERTH